MKKISLSVGISLILIGLSGCQNNKDIKSMVSNSVDITSIRSLSDKKNIYTSTLLSEDTILIAGENGMSLAYMDTSGVNIKYKNKFLKKKNDFKIPIFKLKTEIKKEYKSTTDIQDEDKAKIYSILKIDDGILIGGKFSHVNDQEKDNIVKLKYDGSIDQDFNASTMGAVYKILNVNKSIYLAGVFGAYNDNEAYSIVKIDSKGKMDTSFQPFKDYFLVKINDMESYNNKLILGGTFIKSIDSLDENATEAEVLNNTKSIVIIDEEGQILEKDSNQFNKITNEVFAIEKDDDRIYFAGDFRFLYNNTLYNNLIAYKLNGEFDTSFKVPKMHGMVFDVAIDDDRIIFGGDFTSNDHFNRSFYIVDKQGNIIQINNINIDADIYNIDVYQGNILISGEGIFKLNNKDFNNSIVLEIN